ncbi:MAG: hypothetical protein R6W72_09240 [Desulfurivibrionaceae bacterium]
MVHHIPTLGYRGKIVSIPFQGNLRMINAESASHHQTIHFPRQRSFRHEDK